MQNRKFARVVHTHPLRLRNQIEINWFRGSIAIDTSRRSDATVRIDHSSRDYIFIRVVFVWPLKINL